MRSQEERTEMTEREAERRVRRAFPELSPMKVRHVGTGFDTNVFSVNDCYVFRFPRQEKGRDALLNENHVLQLLQRMEFQAPFSLPEPVFSAEGEPGKFPFVGFSYLPGRELASEADVDLLARHVDEIATFLRSLHSLPVDSSWELEPDTLLRLSAKKRRSMMYECLEEIAPYCEEETAAHMEEYLDTLPEWENPPSSVLVHGDLHPKNLITQNGKLTGIIDWGDAHYGHPASDLALLYQAVPKELHARFFRQYGEVNAEVKELAVFKAVFVSSALARYAVQFDEPHVLRWCHAGLTRALGIWKEDTAY
ncbi:phosphotransferase [Alkalicoccus urumqiensis]|uniref:Aminoglycoside phosphotransferase domain-containing protein n=1 Tax=Alkalicoccus urumqiensis TaxID=1548213 RepID=A0A2P6MJX2_ALKUR|nr:phosphotransferase [Alkalicoccus urumqiensis]PRO66577.1 hypothetical protein C6I21_04330 [Alkalicoccus urumqiensis]